MPEASNRDQLVEATKELLWDVGYEATQIMGSKDR
jgi:hypothetical protein